MRILLTGSDGKIGRVIQKQLQAGGHRVVGFDLKVGNDIRDASAVVQVGRGCEAVVHLAALLGNSKSESAEEIMRTNLLGTWNVLESARVNRFHRIIFMSSADALGVFKGEGSPAYFPIDDAHPCNPTTPYAISKKLAEEACHSFSQLNDIPTICLRPPGIWDEQTYFDVVERRRRKPEYEWHPYWEYGAFIDERDLAALVIQCLQADFVGYDCYLTSSDDITTSGGTSKELARRLFPQVRWKEGKVFGNDPYGSLMDCHRVKQAFSWAPQYSWRRFIEGNSSS